jgi:ubiquinone/menaquinone biosynthesis C-methylase UbiE
VPEVSRRVEYLHRYYPESRFGDFSDTNLAVHFALRVNALITKDSVVLDVGCGRGKLGESPIPLLRSLSILKGKCARAIGIDVDPAAIGNPCLDEVRLIEGDSWPIEDASVDIAMSDSVLEHIADPDRFFAEMARVVKPGGYVCIRTTNLMSYVGIASKLVPNSLHARLLGKISDQVTQEPDVFPTLHRCNTRGKLRRALQRAGFDPVVYGTGGEPTYLAFSKLAYRFGMLHQRFAPNVIKVCLFAFAVRR